MAAAQAGAKLKVDDNTSVTVGGSYYDFGAMKGKAPINAKNNTTTGGLYDEDFDLLEAFVEVGTKVGKYPVAVFGDYVVNAGSDASNDSGYLVGFTLGKCKDPGSKAFRYNYRRVEANAVVGGINDSDFADGGTDGQGHELGFDYQVAKNVKAGVTYFNNDKKMSGSKDDYERVQLDIKFKF